MPPIDYKLYHPEWKTRIRPDILKRADNKCECCGVENKAVGYRDDNGEFIYSEDYLLAKKNGVGFYITTGYLKIILTIAHLDHDISNNDYSNLKAMCQRCHNRYDMPNRAKNRKKNVTNPDQTSLF